MKTKIFIGVLLMCVKWKTAVIILAIILVLALITTLLLLYNNKDKSGGALMKTKEFRLSDPVTKGNMTVKEAIANRRSIRAYSDKKIKETDISQLLWAAQGITDKTRGLRAAPSAGALYPLEIYLAAAMVEGIQAGIYKYNPSNHSLILLKNGDLREDIYNVSLMQDSIKNAAAVIIYCAVFERTVSSYKDRAAQYVYIETGHSAQNVYLQAEALDLGTVAIGAFDDHGIRRVLELPNEEKPVYLMPVGKKLKNLPQDHLR